MTTTVTDTVMKEIFKNTKDQPSGYRFSIYDVSETYRKIDMADDAKRPRTERGNIGQTFKSKVISGTAPFSNIRRVTKVNRKGVIVFRHWKLASFSFL